MIPFTDTRGDFTRVPPIYSPPNITTNSAQPTGSNISETVPKSKVPSRRGRRSNVPPEIREQTRRLKKQNMERRRRACISDKMNALHNLAMNLIGIDPEENHKVEKADILNLCHTVFEGIVKIVNDDPQLKSRLKKLRNNLNESFTCPSMSSTKKTMPSLSTDETMQNSLKLKQENTSMNIHNDNLHHSQNSNLDRIQLFNAQLKQSSPSSFHLSSCTDFYQRFNEENKENQGIQLYTENSLSFDKDCSSIAQPTSSIANPLLLSPPAPSSSFYSCSTPMNNKHQKSGMYSHGNSVFTQYHSTPLKSTGMTHSSFINSDSGYHSSGYTTNSNMYNNESDINITSIDASTSELNVIQSSNGTLLSNPMTVMTSSSSPSTSLLQVNSSSSAFKVPKKRLTDRHSNNNNNNMTGNIHIPMTTNTNNTNNRTMNSTKPNFPPLPPMWRPYLD